MCRIFFIRTEEVHKEISLFPQQMKAHVKARRQWQSGGGALYCVRVSCVVFICVRFSVVRSVCVCVLPFFSFHKSHGNILHSPHDAACARQ